MRDDHTIIEAVLRGELEAFGELVRAYQARLRLACLVRLGNAEEADDAAQDVFVKAFKALDQFKENASFLTWILRIADNHCLDILRSRKTRRVESLDNLLSEKGDVFEGLLARLGKHDVSAAYSPDDFQLLGKLFSALPQADRDILALREVEELSYEAIAERLACSVDAVKGRLKRARMTLADKCGRYFPDTSQSPTRL